MVACTIDSIPSRKLKTSSPRQNDGISRKKLQGGVNQWSVRNQNDRPPILWNPPVSEQHLGTKMPRLLVIDDNPGITEIIETIASEPGFAVRCVNDYREIRNAYREFNPQLIFLDLDLGLDEDMDLSERGHDGLSVFKFLQEKNCQSRIVLVSGMDKEKRQTTKKLWREMKLNVIGSIPKPFAIEKIEALLMQLKREFTATDY